MTNCTHAATVDLDVHADPPPAADGSRACGDCLSEGTRWVHLRLCTSCGHVGCCDSSPRRHATAHFRGTSHPVVQSFEPGEDWLWCYADETAVQL
jgi:CPA1 family monovalent cation:H+ antiporter